MKSISEIAKELNISTQAIYKKVNNQLKTELSTHIHKGLNGKTFIDEKGQAIIKTSLNQQFKTSSQPVDNRLEDDYQKNYPLIEILKKQLEVKDSQIEELLKQNESLIKKVENMQVLLKSEQEKTTSLLTDGQPKLSVWQKIFRRSYTNSL